MNRARKVRVRFADDLMMVSEEMAPCSRFTEQVAPVDA